ncbi:hypothetical protein MMC17_007321 [Xylographa soralifera]|nr:hypothetical protein [Xylographa soralifera]
MGSFAEPNAAFNRPLEWQIAGYGKALSDPGNIWFPGNNLTYIGSPPSEEPFGSSPVSGHPDGVTAWPQSPYSQKYCSEESSVSSRSSSHRSLEEKDTADKEASPEASVSNIQLEKPSSNKKETTKLTPLFVCDNPGCANTKGYKPYDALNPSSLNQTLQHDCRNARGAVVPQRKRPLSNTTQVLLEEPQPHLKRGRYQDSTAGPSTNTPARDNKSPNSSTVLVAGGPGIQSLCVSNSFQDMNAVAYQNGYSSEYFDYTALSSIYNPYDDTTTGLLSSTTWPVEIPHPVDPLLDAPLWRFEINDSTMQEISNVHPADFVALQRIDGLRNLENFLKSAVTTLRTTGIAFITYNTTSRTIRVQGPAEAARKAKQKLEDILQHLYGKADLQVVLRPYMKWSNAFANTMRSRSKKHVCMQNGVSRPQIQTYALRPEDDALISAWMEFMLPSLPAILGPRVGKNYSASLVRIGSSELSTRPCIRIQCPLSQSSYVQQEIREAIRALCNKAGVSQIRLSFSTGSLTLLAGPPRDRSSSHRQVQNEDREEEVFDDTDEGHKDVRDFPYHKRWWKYPGPGASIGLRCTRSVSATLGGYILVDSQLFLLTVDHFIDRSQENRYDPTKGDQLELTSPSLSDVDDMSEELQQTMTDIRAQIAQDIGSQDLSFDNLPSHIMDLQRTYESLNQLRKELDKTDEEFELGKVEHRFSTIVRTSTFKNPSSGMQTYLVNHRMDWALCSTNHRRGENRHRYRCVNGVVNTDSDNPMGDGELCQETCDPEPGVSVYFVGQRSGRQRGRVSSAITLVSLDGVDSQEWSLETQREHPQEEILPGDSGAWVYREDNDMLMGQIWGLQDNLFLFTPIRDIFADIKESLGAANVRLHPGYARCGPAPISNFSSAASTTNTKKICEVKQIAPHKPRGYSFASIPHIRTKENQSPFLPGISSFVWKDEPMVGSSSTSGRRTVSPTPNLSFSPMSPSRDDFALSPSPPPRLMLQYKLRSPSPDVKPPPSETAIMVRVEDEGQKYGRRGDRQEQLAPTSQEPTECRNLNDIDMGHLCGDDRKDIGIMRHSPLPRSSPLSSISKSYTWPVTTDRMGLKLLSKVIPLV